MSDDLTKSMAYGTTRGITLPPPREVRTWTPGGITPVKMKTASEALRRMMTVPEDGGFATPEARAIHTPADVVMGLDLPSSSPVDFEAFAGEVATTALNAGDVMVRVTRLLRTPDVGLPARTEFLRRTILLWRQLGATAQARPKVPPPDVLVKGLEGSTLRSQDEVSGDEIRHRLLVRAIHKACAKAGEKGLDAKRLQKVQAKFGRAPLERAIRELRGRVVHKSGRLHLKEKAEPTEAEVPKWLADALLSRLLMKAVGHKYLKRIPTGDPKRPYRYVYRLTHRSGLTKPEDVKKGAAFKVTDAGHEGHFHVVDERGAHVEIEHDETGSRSTIKREALIHMLDAQHVRGVDAEASATHSVAVMTHGRVVAIDKLPLGESHGHEAWDVTLQDGAGNEARGIIKVSGARRERAAFLLDQRLGGPGVVPPTALRIDREKGEVSVQRYAHGATKFVDTALPVDAATMAEQPSVRRMFLLDVILGHADRHPFNVFVRPQSKGETGPRVIATDNGAGMPTRPEKVIFLFPEALGPAHLVHLDERSVGRLRALDLAAAASDLRGAGIEPEAIVGVLARIRKLQIAPTYLGFLAHDLGPLGAVSQFIARSMEPRRNHLLSPDEARKIRSLAHGEPP